MFLKVDQMLGEGKAQEVLRSRKPDVAVHPGKYRKIRDTHGIKLGLEPDRHGVRSISSSTLSTKGPNNVTQVFPCLVPPHKHK